MTAQQAADAAIEDGKHPDLVPLPESAFDAARSRATARTPRAGAAIARGDCSGAAPRRHDVRGDRASTDWLLVGAAYGALGDLDDATITGRARTRRVDARAALARRGARRLPPRAARRPSSRRVDYAIRAHEILEDVQRDRMGDADRRARHRRRRRRHARGDRRRCTTLLAGRGDALQTVDSRLTQLEAHARADPARARRLAGAGRRCRAPSASGCWASSAPRWRRWPTCRARSRRPCRPRSRRCDERLAPLLPPPRRRSARSPARRRRRPRRRPRREAEAHRRDPVRRPAPGGRRSRRATTRRRSPRWTRSRSTAASSRPRSRRSSARARELTAGHDRPRSARSTTRRATPARSAR